MPKSIYYDENGNEQVLSSSPSALSGLTDVNVSGATQGQVLTKGASSWVATTLNIPTLTETTTGFLPETGTTVVGFKASKLGGMIIISATLQPTFSAVGNKDIGTLPEGYRPSSTVRFVAGNTSKDTQINATITSAGLVSVYATSQNVNLSAQNIAFCVSFT